MWYVYILKSTRKKWYYVGSTNQLKERIEEHNNRRVKSTKHYVPLNFVFQKDFKTESDARRYERKLKQCRKEKEEIIRIIETNNYCRVV